MPILIKKISGEALKNVSDSILYVSTIKGEIQREDYINLNGFIAYTQNLSRTEETYGLNKPSPFGLKNAFNNTIVTLEISY